MRYGLSLIAGLLVTGQTTGAQTIAITHAKV